MFNFFFNFYITAILVAISFVALYLFLSQRKKLREIQQSLNYVLFEVTMPLDEAGEQSFKESIVVMEQFYSGMAALQLPFSLEIGLPYSGNEVVFYCAVPKGKSQLFEKQIQGLYPQISVSIKADDYNVFKPQGYSAGSVVSVKNTKVLPIKTYDSFEADPLQLIINIFSKLQKEGEGAAMQIIVEPTKEAEGFQKKVSSVLLKVRQGKTLSEAMKDGKNTLAVLFDLIEETLSGKPKGPKEEKEEAKVDEVLSSLIEAKASKPIFSANIRLIVSAGQKGKEEELLSELESAFWQFKQAGGNEFTFTRPRGIRLKKLFYNFIFRIPNKKNRMFLNLSELSSVFHFPTEMSSSEVPQLKYVRTKETAPPLNLPSEGSLLGKNYYRGSATSVYMKEEDRRRHFYVIGQTGTGKSVLLKNMIIQDIEDGKGICFIDPHGSDIEDILARIPKERINDVIYFNPSDVDRPMGLNMLEYDINLPEQKSFVVDELLGIFNKLFDMKTAGGPMFEQYFRNATLLVMSDPESGNTLLDISRVMSNKAFRDLKLSKCNNPVVRTFWKEVAEKAGGEASLQNMVPYIVSKFDIFLSNEIMRPIISQEKSSFNFREVMDGQKILLVNLSKGRLGELNSSLIGLIIVGKLLMAALSRVDIPQEQRKDFYLYIDEFQNVTTDSIATILSEARKYRLNLTIAHQFIAQIPDNIKDAVFGNVGSMAAFRVGEEDAAFLENKFDPVYTANDIANIDNYNAILKLLIDGHTARPFNIQTIRYEDGDSSYGAQIAALSSQKYGRLRVQVEEEIMKRYQE